jgi:hypothetical protein
VLRVASVAVEPDAAFACGEVARATTPVSDAVRHDSGDELAQSARRADAAKSIRFAAA